MMCNINFNYWAYSNISWE